MGEDDEEISKVSHTIHQAGDGASATRNEAHSSSAWRVSYHIVSTRQRILAFTATVCLCALEEKNVERFVWKGKAVSHGDACEVHERIGVVGVEEWREEGGGKVQRIANTPRCCRRAPRCVRQL